MEKRSQPETIVLFQKLGCGCSFGQRQDMSHRPFDSSGSLFEALTGMSE